MLDDDGRIVVLDFGLARQLGGLEPTLTASHDPIGTPAYMAPEQVRGGTVGPASDVHALGAILFELLTLSTAFAGVQRDEILHRVVSEAPPRLRLLRRDAPRDLELLVSACLDKEPRRRCVVARALAADLRRVLLKQPIAVRPLPLALRVWRWSERNRVRRRGSYFLLLLAATAGWFSIAQARSDRAMRGRRLVLAAVEAADDSDLAALLAEASYRLQPSAESLDFLRNSLFSVHEERRLRRPGATHWFEFVPVDPERVLVAGSDPWCEVWRLDGLEPEQRLPMPAVPVAIAVGPDRSIAIATLQQVRLFDAEGRPQPWQRDGLRGVRSLCWLAERTAAMRAARWRHGARSGRGSGSRAGPAGRARRCTRGRAALGGSRHSAARHPESRLCDARGRRASRHTRGVAGV